MSDEEEINGTHRGRLNARGYEQVDESHYATDCIAAPVTYPRTVCFPLTLLCMNPTCMAVINDVKGEFLQEELSIERSCPLKSWMALKSGIHAIWY